MILECPLLILLKKRKILSDVRYQFKFLYYVNKTEKKLKWSRYRPDVAQRVGRGIALLFHDGGTRRGWVVSSKPRPHFTPRKDPVPVLQEAGWAPGPVWTGGKSRPHWDSIPDRPAPRQSLYRLSCPAHNKTENDYKNKKKWVKKNLLLKLFFLSTRTLQPSVQNVECKNAVMFELWFSK